MIRSNRYFIPSLLLVLIVTLTPGNGKIFGDVLDKVVHFMIFFILSINMCYSFKERKTLMTGMMFATLLAFGTEGLQQFVPGRNMDIIDGIADILGIVVGYFIYQKNKKVFDRYFIRFGA